MIQQEKDRIARIKESHPVYVCIFKSGEFYEVYGNDAVLVHTILNIPISRRKNIIGSELVTFPLCELNTNLAKLIRAGQRVALAE